MRFGVLGPLAVWTDDDRPVPVPGVKVRALLADLLAHEGRPVPADRLIDDLWGEALPGNPPGALSAKVSQLRRVLEDAEPGARALVATRPAGYLLQVEGDRVDAHRFRSLVARARETAGPADRAAVLAEALALWRGPALPDFADEPFAQAVIARLEELRLTTLEDHAEVRLALGEHGVLAGELGDLLAAHPFRERLRAAHLRALYRAGRPSEALESYERLRTELADELGLDPGPELAALHQAILTQDPALDAPAAGARPRTNLHAPASPLIGRDDAVTEICARLAAEATGRLVTLTGPGGVGKTRLAVEAAGRLADGFPDGVWLVELAALDRAAVRQPAGALTDLVMRVLDVRDAPGGSGSPVDRLATALAARRTLLVLDNCEHIVEPVAELVAALLRAAPGLRVLATSREPLGPSGEVVWNVPPLEVPGRDAALPELERTAAVRLFADRAAAAARGFRLDAESAAAVAVLCRRLDGIPLALELAATRVRSLGVHGLVARLDDRFRLLATGHRGAPPRQRTLTAMIDWSWELLPEPERAVLRRLAVHADGCTLEAAEAVCAGDDLPAGEVLDLLVRLVDRSLVVMAEHGDDGPRGPRYRLLESVAAYCADRMDELGEHDRVRRAHQEYHTGLAERAEPHLHGHDQARSLRLLDAESANLRTALDGAVAGRDAGLALRLGNALTWYWFLRGRLAEGLRSLDAALALDGGPAEHRARALAWRTGLGVLQGDTAGWPARRAAALRALDGVADPAVRTRAQWFLAYTGVEVDGFAPTDDLLDRVMAGFQAAGDRWGEAATRIVRAQHAHFRSDTAALERESERAARLFGGLGDRWGQLQAAEWLAAHAELTGDHERAARLQREGLRMAEDLRLWPDVAMRLAWLGWTSMMLRAYPRAREYSERALRMATEQGHRSIGWLAEFTLASVTLREGDLDTAETCLRALLRAAAPWETTGDGDDDAPAPHTSMIQVPLGHLAELRGDAAGALACHRDALAGAIRFEAPRDSAGALEGLAGALSLAGHQHAAARMLGAATGIRRSLGLAPSPLEREDIDRATARIRAVLAEEDFATESARGGTLSPADCLREVEGVRSAGARG
ncbi:AfsR/SARP family transcriptional regulator [Actinomadura craniellae]|uniref:AfsR/SARP family transcriptional regulator n=1 Tax=Actinomadura craniellae TaxID=2231787 RepID=A0A365GW75_9ACTN|nr:BTAD domain-containing putative transcriptional regulator [Actinomadura craniellae]RAY11066.1 AfsR/SARP family transcriptional regulator [Actinomadura craniellae]